MKQRDKRAMRLAHNRERWADAWAPITEPEPEDDDGDFDYMEPTGEDMNYLEARRMHG